MPKLTNIETILGIKFTNKDLLGVALTHRSYLNEHRRVHLQHNERMEFLGDAVLELVVTEYLYKNYDQPEGLLTNWRSALVRTESLSAIALDLGLYEYVRLSRGEAKGSQRAKTQIMANTFEAILGAIYLDKGYQASERFIIKHVISRLPHILESGSWQDPKTKLQEIAQEVDGFTPIYEVLSEKGPDHDKTFTVGVYVGKKLQGKGVGASKQAAQQEAASKALAHYLKNS